jgi:Arc/MetJ-type ribon-helix-helix transcriptional regulator
MGNRTKDPRLAQKDIWNLVQEKLKESGLELENFCCDDATGSRVKVVCIASDLRESFEEMGQFPRGQTVMIRTDEETSDTLDAWVETGYFKSRSEAAALFLREGLKLRASELKKLSDTLQQVKKAKERLHEKATEIFGKEKKAE